MSRLRLSLLYSFLQNYVALGLNIVTTVILARILSPSETGLYSIAAGIINILQVLREFGTGPYIIQEPDLSREKLAGAMTVSLGFGGALALLFLALAGPIAAFFAEPRLVLLIRLLSLNFLFVGISGVAMAQLQRAMRFDAVMRISTAQNFTHSGLSILLASAGFGALGMAWSAVCACLVTLLGCAVVLRRDLWITPSLTAWRAPFRFGAFACSGNLLAALGARLPDIVVGRLLGFSSAGIYSRGNGLITLFQQAVMYAITPVAESALAELRRGGADIAAPYLQTLRFVTIIAWPCLGMMAHLALPIILIAFGPVWLPAVPVARIMCLATGFVVVTSVTVALMTASGAVRRFFLLQAISVPILVLVLLVGCRGGITGAAIGVAFWSAALSLVSLHQAQKIVGLSVMGLLRPFGASLIALAATLSGPLLLSLWLPVRSDQLILPSLAAAAAGLAGWLCCLAAQRHPLIGEMRRLLRRRRP